MGDLNKKLINSFSSPAHLLLAKSVVDYAEQMMLPEEKRAKDYQKDNLEGTKGLHQRWKQVPEGLDLSVPICFASDNDILGGNSGSAVINRNAEVVGLIHDGNLESLAGSYVFIPEVNRAVSTDSWGLMEGLMQVYKAQMLVKELKAGKSNLQ